MYLGSVEEGNRICQKPLVCRYPLKGITALWRSLYHEQKHTSVHAEPHPRSWETRSREVSHIRPSQSYCNLNVGDLWLGSPVECEDGCCLEAFMFKAGLKPTVPQSQSTPTRCSISAQNKFFRVDTIDVTKVLQGVVVS